jgi:uncharacterized LabA/DUF88 family protein
LDVHALAANLIKSHQSLEDVYYFTARVRNAPEKEKRQNTYLEALQTYSRVTITYGRFQPNIITCYSCGHSYSSPNEKMTDVNIATRILVDSFQNKFDTAFLISGDTDLIPPIREIKSLFPNKRIVVAFPPGRHNISLQNQAHASFIIGRKKLLDSQLPEEVTKPDGFTLRRPDEWT